MRNSSGTELGPQKEAYPAVGAIACSPLAPPTPRRTIGSAIAKPASFTVSCTRLTQADPNRPPAAKYAVTSTPPSAQPAGFGTPATTSRMRDMPRN